MGSVLGLDLGTRTGWGMLDAATGARQDSGTWDLGKDSVPGLRYLELEVRVRAVLLSLDRDPAAVAYERVRPYGSFQAQAVYFGLLGRLMTVVADLGLQAVGVAPATLKKLATGSGRASKDRVRQAARERWGVPCRYDDEADALWIAEWGRGTLEG